jgi:hypothetical protein
MKKKILIIWSFWLFACQSNDSDSISPNKLLKWKGFDWKTIQFDNINLYVLPNSLADKNRDLLQDRIKLHYQSILKLVGIEKYDQTIHYFITNSREQNEVFTGMITSGTAYPNTNTLLTAYAQNHDSVNEHELYHVISINTWDYSDAWIIEGSAVHASIKWGNYPLHNLNNYLKKQGKLVGLSNLTSNKFRDVNAMLSYPQAGSFVKFLYEKYGREKFIELWKNKDFKKTYNKSVEELETEWLDEIKNYSTDGISYNI